MAPAATRRVLGVTITLPLIAVLVGTYWRSSDPPATDHSCVSKVERLEVRGDSLSGLVEAGASVDVEYDFYRCNPVRRDDLVLLQFAGNPAPIAKIVRGLPGDRFALVTVDGKWRLVINDDPVRNHAGEPYGVDLPAQRMLSLYERDYGGVIPPDAFLVLGNRVATTTDSRRFGLVGRGDLLGKVSAITPPPRD